MNFLMTFVVGQSFLSMMCAMKFGIFLFFAGMVVLMSAFVAIVLPETQGIPLVTSLPRCRCPLIRCLAHVTRLSFLTWRATMSCPSCSVPALPVLWGPVLPSAL